MIRAGRAKIADRPSRTVTWLALLAFLLQGLIVQSHIHMASIEAAVPVHHGQHQPAPKTPDECPACQLQAATGAILVPDAILTLLALSWVETRHLPASVTAILNAVRQGWQSRAPPLH